MSLALGLPITATVEHLLARSKGGPKTKDNEVGACHECNQARGNKSPAAFFAEVAAKSTMTMLAFHVALYGLDTMVGIPGYEMREVLTYA